VADLFRNTLRLQFKVQRQRREKAGRPAGGTPSPDSIEELLEPEHLSKLSPRELSYWIANSFSVRRWWRGWGVRRVGGVGGPVLKGVWLQCPWCLLG
jgi:hypothetical protein